MYYERCAYRKLHNVYFIIPIGACEKFLERKKQNISNNRFSYQHTHEATK